jgi:hypothetical protein
MLSPITQQIFAISFPSLPIHGPQVEGSRSENMALTLAQKGSKSIIGTVEWLAALVVAACAHRPLELDEIAIRTLHGLFPSLSKPNRRFGVWGTPKLPYKIASLELVLT